MASPLPNETLYERDFYAWTEQQAALLRAGHVTSADIENIVEEIETMGRSEKGELVNRLATLLAHLLKWQFQPEYKGRSWQLTIEEQRLRLGTHLEENPSLKAKLPESIDKAYRLALIIAQRETVKSANTFPAVCPYSFDQMLDDAFFPQAD